MRRDLFIAETAILKMHPAVGVFVTEAQMKQNFVRLKSNLTDSLTQKEFRMRLKMLIEELHCGHTEVLYSRQYYRGLKHQALNYSPYIFLPVGDQLHVLGYLGKKQDSLIKKGMPVVSLNGIASDSMLHYSQKFVTTDGYNRSGKEYYVQLAVNSFIPVLFGRPDTFHLAVKDAQHELNIQYPAIKLKSLPPLPLGPKDDTLFSRYRQAKIKYRYLTEDKKTMVMKLDKFSHSGDLRAYRKLFGAMKENGTENLVLDLRNNGGGSLANSYRLLTYLLDSSCTQTLRTKVKHYPIRNHTKGDVVFQITKIIYSVIGKRTMKKDTDVFVYTIKPRVKNHFDGKIFVLINGGSFSASALVCAYLKASNKAVFIGQETGGGAEGSNAGLTPFYTLPESGIQVRVPAFRVVHDVWKGEKGRGIIPDYPITYSFKDIVGRKDLELMKVKELLEIKN